LRPAKARLEFENARTLAERGIAAVEPLAWGHRDSAWPGESFLITRAEETAKPFLEFAARILPTFPASKQTAARRQIARDAIDLAVARRNRERLGDPRSKSSRLG
jgi:hypothetical protein